MQQYQKCTFKLKGRDVYIKQYNQVNLDLQSILKSLQ